ncbi:MAG: oligosaccharide flippase family protein [Balneolaceae bacterium]
MKKIQQKAFWIAFGDFSWRGFSFITSIYLARTLGTEYYGLIVIAISMLGYCFWFADLGLVNIAIREVAKVPEKRLFRAKEIFNMKVFLGMVVLIFSFLIISNLDIESDNKNIVLGYLYSIIPYALMMEWYFNGRQQFGKVALSKAANGFVYFAFIFLLIKKPEDITLVPYIYVAGTVVAAIILGVFAFFDKPFPLPSRGINIYGDLLKTSSVLGIGWFFTQLVQLLPPILIGIFLSVSQAGLYGAAYRIIIIVMLLDRVFINLLLPNLSAIWSTDRSLAKERVNMVLKIIIAGGIMLTTLMALNAEFAVSLLYGTDYVGSVIILKYLSLFILFTFMNSLFSFGLIATGKDREYLIANVIGGIISAVLIISFAKFGSSKGVAISVTVSEFVMMSCAYYWFNKTIPVKFITVFLILFTTALLYFIIASTYQIHFIIASIGSVLLLSFVSWITGAVRLNELLWLKNKWS